MKKRLLSTFLSCICFFAILTSNVLASQTFAPTDNEIAQIEKALGIFDTATDLGKKTDFDLSIQNYDIENLHKVYFLVTMPIQTYNSTKSINSIISNEYNFRLPISTGTGQNVIATLVPDKTTGEIEFAGMGEGVFPYKNIISKTIEAYGIDATEITEPLITFSALYNTYFVFFEKDNTSFCIPFTSHGKELKIESGIVYTTNDLFSQLYNTFDESLLEENPNSNGGFPYRQTNNNIFIICGLIIITLLTIALIRLYKRKKLKA